MDRDNGHDDDNDMADWGESAGDLLAQFQAQSSAPRVDNAPRVESASPSSSPVEVIPAQELSAVELPPVADGDEYHFLPGHFDVHCVISEKSVLNAPESYQVKLRSGELLTVSL
jgi:chromodomain-helicase-DNA-binding protein 4